MTEHITRREALEYLTAAGVGLTVLPTVLDPLEAVLAARTERARPTLRYAGGLIQGRFEYPQPFGFQTGPSFTNMTFLFDSLMWRDSTRKPIHWLADHVSVAKDQRTWTFRLRRNARFHDGRQLTSADVVFSYNYIKAHATPWWSSMEMIQSVKAIGKWEVRIRLTQPYAPFLNNLASQVPILPHHIWGSVTDPVRFTGPTAFVGSGPYMLKAFDTTTGSFDFQAYNRYFLGAPYVKRIQLVPAADQLLTLKTGAIDVANPGGVTQGAVPDALAPFQRDPAFGILRARGEGTVALHFNLLRGKPYSDRAFRQAVFYAINRQDLVKRVLFGLGEIGSPGFLAPINAYANKAVEHLYPHSHTKANRLLNQAGYLMRDGKRQMPNGDPLTIPLLFAANLMSTAQLIRDELAQIGITVMLQPVDPGTANAQQGAGNFSVSLVTYGGLGSDPDFMRRAFASPADAKFWWKAWGYHDTAFNRLAARQDRTLRFGERKKLVEQMQAIIAADVPLMPLYYPSRILVYRKKVFSNWYFTPLWNPLPWNKQAFVSGKKKGS